MVYIHFALLFACIIYAAKLGVNVDDLLLSQPLLHDLHRAGRGTTLLAALESNHVPVNAACRAGVCGIRPDSGTRPAAAGTPRNCSAHDRRLPG